MANSGVYSITNTVNGDFYVGSSVNLRKRLNRHRRGLIDNCHGNAHLQNAWNLYGENSFTFETILLCDKSMTLYYEQALLDGLMPAYNIAICATASMQGLQHSEETKRKIGATQTGELHPMFGKHHTAAARALISEGGLGNKNALGGTRTEEQKRKISEALKGRVVSAETRALMSLSATRRQAKMKAQMGNTAA